MLSAIKVLAMSRQRCCVAIAIICIGVLATKCQPTAEASSIRSIRSIRSSSSSSSYNDMEASCQCITHSGTGGNEWGALIIAPNLTSLRSTTSASASASATTSDCLVVYIRAAPDEIVELRLYEIILRPGCTDSLQVHAHLRSATITQTALNDELICAESAATHIANRHPHAVDQLWEEHMLNVGAMADADHAAQAAATVRLDWQTQREAATRLRINNRRAILSSGSLLAVRLKMGPLRAGEATATAAFSVKADFRFHQRALFKIDGNLLPTTLCDYQFLPYPINYVPAMVVASDGGGQHQQQQHQHQPQWQDSSQPGQPPQPTWRYFFSPRYPAKYAAHVKCAYKFIGRPNSHVEVVFEEIDLPPAIRDASKSCAGASDRLTIYDSRSPDTTTIVDVLCQAAPRQRKRVHSAGAQLLIEFESSSNRSSNGFSAKYRFLESSSVPQSAQINNAPAAATSTTRTAAPGDTGRGQLLGTSSSSSGHTVDQLTAFGFSYISRGTESGTGTSTDIHNNINNNINHNIASMASMATTTVVVDDHHHQQHLVLAAAGIAMRTGPTAAPQSSRPHQQTVHNGHGGGGGGGGGGGAGGSGGGGGGYDMTMNMGNTSANNSSSGSSGSNNATDDSPDTAGDSNGSGRAGDSGCPPVSNCDIVLSSNTSKSGTITSPMFPSPYTPKTYCRFEFRGTGKERVQLSFMDFTLPSDGDGDDCDQADTLIVLMPSKGRFEPVEVLCGYTLPKPIMSNGPRMLIEFRGRNSGRGNRGIRAEYKFVENFGITSGHQLAAHDCSFEFNSSTESSGWFLSPNFPGNYPRNVECNYYFHGNAMEKVNIRFTYFDVEGIFPCDSESSSDTVEFSNFQTLDRKFPLYCEKKEKFHVESDGKYFRVTFRSNDRLDGTGFRAAYEFRPTIRPTTELVPMVVAAASPKNGRDMQQQKQSNKQTAARNAASGGRGGAGAGRGLSNYGGVLGRLLQMVAMLILYTHNQLAGIRL